MPMKPKRPCRYPGCPNLCEDGEQYCPEHKALMKKHYETFTRGYSPGKRYGRSWQRVRTRYVHKHPLCEMCLKQGRYVAVEEVHHIVPLSEGGTNDESNLMSLCRSCHEKIHRERGDRGTRHDR
jgi:5-methylcytosine-specific restriction protein A